MIELLISHGARVDAKDDDDDVPLCTMIVGDAGSVCVHTLADLGYDVPAMRCGAFSVFSAALHEAWDETVIALMERGCRMPSVQDEQNRMREEWVFLLDRASRNPTIALLAERLYPEIDVKSLRRQQH